MTAFSRFLHCLLLAERGRPVIVLQSGHRPAIERDGPPSGPVNQESWELLAAEQIRRNLAAKMLVCMAVSTKMRCLPPCVSISPLHRVNGSLRQAAQGRSLPLTRLRGLSHGRLDSKTHARKNDAAKFLRKLTATNRSQKMPLGFFIRGSRRTNGDRPIHQAMARNWHDDGSCDAALSAFARCLFLTIRRSEEPPLAVAVCAVAGVPGELVRR